MIDWPGIALAAVLGAGLGALFFGGLWLTVRALPTARYPAALSLGSLAVRSILVMAGFYVVSAGHWERLIAALVGFVLARIALVQFMRPSRPEQSRARSNVREGEHRSQP